VCVIYRLCLNIKTKTV